MARTATICICGRCGSYYAVTIDGSGSYTHVCDRCGVTNVHVIEINKRGAPVTKKSSVTDAPDARPVVNVLVQCSNCPRFDTVQFRVGLNENIRHVCECGANMKLGGDVAVYGDRAKMSNFSRVQTYPHKG